METILAYWMELPPQDQIIILDIGKITFLVILTLSYINKIRQWLIPFKLENCFKLPPLDKKKSTPSGQQAPWLSTSLAYGICLSLAGMLLNQFILQKPLWTATQNESLIKFWGIVLLYLLLIYLLKQFLTALSEIFKTPAIENFIEETFDNRENSNPRYPSIPLSSKLIHYITFALYSGIAWLLGFMLIIELFDLQLLSGLIISLFESTGEVFIALLMLLIAYWFYAQQTDKDTTHIKQSNLVLICCVLLGALIIGGSSIFISNIPWLFLLVVLCFFLIRPDKESIADFFAGIYIRLSHHLLKNKVKAFQINKIGVFETEITYSPGKQEKIKNSKLLSICSSFDNEAPEDN